MAPRLPVSRVTALAALLALVPHARSRADEAVTLLPPETFAALAAESSGDAAQKTVEALAAFHRVQASSGYHQAAMFVAEKARAYGLSDVRVESFPADGKTTYGTFRSYLGWEAEEGVLAEVSPRRETLGDFATLKVALADYSNSADVTAALVDVGGGTKDADYEGRDVKGRIVLAGGNVATVHEMAVGKRGAAGILSYQPNQTTGWSGDFPDLVRWGHLSPYGTKNAFAFMISLRKARAYRERLARGEEIRLHARVKARVAPGAFEVVVATIPGTDPAAGEVLFTCHLCHQLPGANDNASGSAAILEVARTLARLVRNGKVPRPRRTIRFLWPPEIAGTMCYLSRHPEVARAAKAAIHMDMVGGSYERTKAVLHVTRTPASLPSFVNDVASHVAERVIDGSRRAAGSGDVSLALYAESGTKERLVAEPSPHSMGSDHDVLQEGSFRIPTIYLNDWPDVFIHTDGDRSENLDATKLRRVVVIGAASGLFLASAGPEEARRLALEVFARGAGRQGEALRRALALGDTGPVTVERFERAQATVEEAARQEREALDSTRSLAPSDSRLSDLVALLTERVAARAADSRALVQRTVPIPADVVPDDPEARMVPKRSPDMPGPVKVYYADFLLDRIGKSGALDDALAYEALNLVDGKRSVREIRDVLRAGGAEITSRDLAGYYRLLEEAGLLTRTGR